MPDPREASPQGNGRAVQTRRPARLQPADPALADRARQLGRPDVFCPERIVFGGRAFDFVDGGITPYNNPALIAALMATEPAYGIQWPAGEKRLFVLSVGTGHTRVRYADPGLSRWNWQGSLPFVVAKTISALIDGSIQQQDFLCGCSVAACTDRKSTGRSAA